MGAVKECVEAKYCCEADMLVDVEDDDFYETQHFRGIRSPASRPLVEYRSVQSFGGSSRSPPGGR